MIKVLLAMPKELLARALALLSIAPTLLEIAPIPQVQTRTRGFRRRRKRCGIVRRWQEKKEAVLAAVGVLAIRIPIARTVRTVSIPTIRIRIASSRQERRF
jgi:hypothetical protein